MLNSDQSQLEVRLVGHACVLLKYKNTSIILDPWFGFPLNYGAFHPFPPFGPPGEEELKDIGAIHISHMHSDHFCERSLSYFRRNVPVFVARQKDRQFVGSLKRLGFTDIREIDHGGSGVEFGELRLYSFISTRTFPFDSSLVVEAGGEAFLFDNDARFGMLHYFTLSRYFQKIGGVCLGFAEIWPFPSCFDFSECSRGGGGDFKKDYLNLAEEEAWRKIESICEILKPTWVFPYASGLRFRNSDLIHHNQMFFDARRIFDRNLRGAKPILLQPGDSITGLQIQRAADNVVRDNEPVLPMLADVTVKGSEILDRRDELIEAYLAAMAPEISKWMMPMTIRLCIKDSELESFKIDLNFNGAKLSVSQNELSDLPDLEISYPADGIKKFLDKSWSFHNLHYCYRIIVKVHRIVDGQIAVHRW